MAKVTQAERIIEKFGTQSALADALGIRQSAVAAWKKRGFIPARQQEEILRIARRRGINIGPKDFFSEAAA
jgi:DNA-binding transcriptional regulator YiaG